MVEAHGNQAPFFGVNTVAHEVLHVLMGDVFEVSGGAVHGQSREARVDWYATKMWLFGDGAAARESAVGVLRRLGGGAEWGRVRGWVADGGNCWFPHRGWS